MSSEARITANRLNAQKSTGPRTAEGKATVSQNAVKHGLLAGRDVIRGEDQEEFNQYREELFWEFVPVGIMESRLAERIVSLAWRLRRAERMHNEAFDALLAKATSGPLAWLTESVRPKGADQPDRSNGGDGDLTLGRVAVRDFANSRVLDRLLMYERRIESSLYRTMAELQKLRRAEKPQAYDAGIGRRTRRDAEQDAQIATDGGHSPACEDASVPALSENVIDFAKQSQSMAAEDIPCSVPVGASVETQDVASLRGRGTSAANDAKQSQLAPMEDVPCSVPVGASVETQDVASLRGGAASAGECAKQSQRAVSAAV